ncbi:hypothetical protein SDC9_50568 [bioreactor metagenome]|uniref:Holin n=1 Tax=bioreactor metagenome TaxID=1076179 RepID=A0A644WKG5_9ZZZZ
MEQLNEILIKLAFAGVCAIIGILLKMYKEQILATVTKLVQEAESTIQGSGLGEEKKAKVVAQLQAMGISVNTWLDKKIDEIVAYLNDKGGWLVSTASETAHEAIEKVIESTPEENSAE